MVELAHSKMGGHKKEPKASEVIRSRQKDILYALSAIYEAKYPNAKGILYLYGFPAL
jgi:hypothetical protein